MDESSEIIRLLLETNKELTKEIVGLSKELAQVKSPVFETPKEVAHLPWNTPETEEDADFLLNTGQIDGKEHGNILKELQFYNAEITTPAGE